MTSYISKTFLILIGIVLIGCGGKQEKSTSAKPAKPQGAVATNAQSQIAGGHVHFGNLFGDLPSNWKSIPPASSMRMAEFVLPGITEEDAPGHISVFYFGPDAGGIEPNIERWINQFESADGSDVRSTLTREELDINGMKCILVYFNGTQKELSMPGAPATPRQDNWMNLSAIVIAPDGPWFLKGTGPENTMKQHIGSMKKFLHTIKYSDGHAHQH